MADAERSPYAWSRAPLPDPEEEIRNAYFPVDVDPSSVLREPEDRGPDLGRRTRDLFAQRKEHFRVQRWRVGDTDTSL